MEALQKNEEEQHLPVIMELAERFRVDPKRFWATVKTVAPAEANATDILAFLIVANEYKLNPLTREIWLLKNKHGKILPVVSVDGWINLAKNHPHYGGMCMIVGVEDKDEYVETTMWDKRFPDKPITVREYMSECNRASEDNYNPWNKWPKRMLRHKSLIQCARYAFGFSGIYDPDEANRITHDEVEYEVIDEKSEEAKRLAAKLGEATGKFAGQKIAEGIDSTPLPEYDGPEGAIIVDFEGEEETLTETPPTSTELKENSRVGVCPMCGQKKALTEHSVCGTCEPKLLKMSGEIPEEQFCPDCGEGFGNRKKYKFGDDEVCFRCLQKRKSADRELKKSKGELL